MVMGAPVGWGIQAGGHRVGAHFPLPAPEQSGPPTRVQKSAPLRVLLDPCHFPWTHSCPSACPMLFPHRESSHCPSSPTRVPTPHLSSLGGYLPQEDFSDPYLERLLGFTINNIQLWFLDSTGPESPWGRRWVFVFYSFHAKYSASHSGDLNDF